MKDVWTPLPQTDPWDWMTSDLCVSSGLFKKTASTSLSWLKPASQRLTFWSCFSTNLFQQTESLSFKRHESEQTDSGADFRPSQPRMVDSSAGSLWPGLPCGSWWCSWPGSPLFWVWGGLWGPGRCSWTSLIQRHSGQRHWDSGLQWLGVKEQQTQGSGTGTGWTHWRRRSRLGWTRRSRCTYGCLRRRQLSQDEPAARSQTEHPETGPCGFAQGHLGHFCRGLQNLSVGGFLHWWWVSMKPGGL